MSKDTTVNWRTGVPEDSCLEATKAFGCEFFQVLVSGRYDTQSHLLVSIVNRMRRQKTGYDALDSSSSRGVPLDGKWHWQTGMAEIVAWCPLPDMNDPRWISCQEKLPEEAVKIYTSGRLEMITVLAVHEVYEGIPRISMLNRVNIKKSGIPFLDEQATEGWVWSNNAGNVLAWMPVPAPFSRESMH